MNDLTQPTNNMNTKYPWNYDTENLPILDTPQKLTDYASAVLHEPANPRYINFTPHSLEAVELYYGLSRHQEIKRFKETMKHLSTPQPHACLPSADDIADMMNTPPTISLGLVNGIAAETIKSIRQAQDSL